MDHTGNPEFDRALDEILGGAGKLQKFSESNQTPEFRQFCIKTAYDVWANLRGCKDDRTRYPSERPAGPAYHGHGGRGSPG